MAKARSYLLSVLGTAARGMDVAAFRQKFPHAWLVWEPGRWQPPRGSTIQTSTEELQKLAAREQSGEALALALSLPDGGGELALGRADACELAINDGTLSSRHLTFGRAGHTWTIKDVGSRNGTSIDGALLRAHLPAALRDGARIQAGQVHLTFYLAEGMLGRLRAEKR